MMTTTVIIVITCKCGGMSWRYLTYGAFRGIRVHGVSTVLVFNNFLTVKKLIFPSHCAHLCCVAESFVVTRGRGRRAYGDHGRGNMYKRKITHFLYLNLLCLRKRIVFHHGFTRTDIINRIRFLAKP